MSPVQDSASYPLPSADRHSEESARLAHQFEVLQEFIGGLTFAPLETIQPKEILELGSGTGAWAALAADTYPNAQVLAVDLVELPERSKRLNLKFERFDLRKPLPWQPESFDVVHSRLTIMHISNGKDVLLRVLPLLKPGGILILEDTVSAIQPNHDMKRTPGMATFWRNFEREIRNKGVDPELPLSYTQILEDSGLFDEVHSRKEFCNFSTAHLDTPLGRVSAMGAQSFQIGPLRHYPGTTPELTAQIIEEMADPALNETFGYDFHFFWARRKA
ncbi:hypothetical protein Clacol_007964 [Clathrus columnatus]|uniref:S-adenosyl-L-methionine-dependent methyltransferase n=1 Tax=Clathrus columnatus TaxID=1419009 RepID=A0AAV5ALZ0_9AGAM|nr:hypothetical protein Clacol_007964 [Clathrus columnatus]